MFAGKLSGGSPGVPVDKLIAEESVSLLAAALRIQVRWTQPFEFGLSSSC